MIVLRNAWRALLLLTGTLLLYLSAPHAAPWQMASVQSSLTEHTLVRVQRGNLALTSSLTTFRICLTLIVAAFVLITPNLRYAVRWVFSNVKRGAAWLFALAYLFFTLRPSPGGWGIILYLLLGSTGVVFVCVGGWPILTFLSERLAPIARRIRDSFFGMAVWRLILLLFVWSLAATNIGSYVLFEHIPHVQDSLDQVFHGKIFLLGRLTVPSPEPRAFFDFTHMINNGKWYSEYPVGHSLLMSLGHLVHAPWLINPLFGSLCVVLLYFIGREMYDDRIGRLAALFGSLSPFLLFMSSGFMNHTTTLFFVELFLLGFVRMIHQHRMRDAALASAALGYAFNIRPMTIAAVAVPFIVYVIVDLIQHRTREHWRQMALCYGTTIVVGAGGIAVFLGFNLATNGDPFLSGYEVLHGAKHNPGFGHSGWGEPHTPARGYRQTLNNLNALNKYLFELPVPALLFALLVFASAKANRWDWLLLSYPSAISIAYFFYWFQDWCFGPRFLFASTAAWILLTARGLSLLPDVIQDLFRPSELLRSHRAVLLVIVLCWCLGWASNLPALVRTYSNSYWGTNRQVLNAVEESGITNALVFVHSYYGSVFPANDPLLRSSIVYARDLGAERNRELIERFPERRVYLADGNSLVPYP